MSSEVTSFISQVYDQVPDFLYFLDAKDPKWPRQFLSALDFIYAYEEPRQGRKELYLKILNVTQLALDHARIVHKNNKEARQRKIVQARRADSAEAPALILYKSKLY